MFLCCAAVLAGMSSGAETPEPVKIQVVDAATGEPVTRFTYEYWIDSPDRHGFPTARDNVEAVTADGVIRIPAPQRCSLSVCATSPWHLARNCREFKILPNDQQRTFTLKITRGATVRGVVLDVATGKPLAGARVSPRYFGHPLVWIDTERAVKTDEKGRFELGGVDKWYGVCVERQGYEPIGDWREFEAKMQLHADGGENTFRLQPRVPRKETGRQETEKEIKPRLFGCVVDERGEPAGPYRVVAAAMQDPDALIGNKEYYFEEEVKDVPAGKGPLRETPGNSRRVTCCGTRLDVTCMLQNARLRCQFRRIVVNPNSSRKRGPAVAHALQPATAPTRGFRRQTVHPPRHQAKPAAEVQHGLDPRLARQP